MMSDPIFPYGPGPGDRKSQVRRMFNRIAWRYDALNAWLSLGIHRRWHRRAAMALARPHSSLHLLDLATGTADLAIALARRSPASHITGIDPAEAMLEIGREKVDRMGLGEKIRLKPGEAENLPQPDNTFDAVTVAFGVRNFQSLKGGLLEIHRVLKPGGQLIILEFSMPGMWGFRHLYRWYFRHLVPRIGQWLSNDPQAYRYLVRSVQAFPQGTAFEALLKSTGFKNTRCTPLTFGVCSLYTAYK